VVLKTALGQIERGNHQDNCSPRTLEETITLWTLRWHISATLTLRPTKFGWRFFKGKDVTCQTCITESRTAERYLGLQHHLSE